ncbi:MAG: hypothetical protein WBZ36_26385 [Candidatus Nitrosopolaris sp.]
MNKILFLALAIAIAAVAGVMGPIAGWCLGLAYALCSFCCRLCASSRVIPVEWGQLRMIRRSVKVGKPMAKIHAMAPPQS